mmetsp:Transcript_48029/g.139105  ORF Transcript_48029/g.139105 Transcript_48029/m.139105 type:complete len:272 (+) Transcript_48029:58-873(+)
MAASLGELKKSRPARWLLTAALGVAALGLLARYVVLPLVAWRRAESCERPEYAVVGSLKAETAKGVKLAVELRRYQPYLVAEVEMPRGLSEEERRSVGFRQVAGYIFGDNLRRQAGFLGRHLSLTESEPEPITMTAPVQSELHPAVQKTASEEDAETAMVSFMMPSKYKSLRELPVPTNSNVTLRAVPEHYAAVVGFRGPSPRPPQVSEVERAVRAALAGAGLKAHGSRGVLVYQYHDPFATPGMLRWNEVVLLVDADGVEKAMQSQKEES